MYAQLAQKCGVSYRYVSWVIRGVKERPVLEARIREVLAAHTKDAT
jgi:transcriptional regulator with XRE-family HTH domain